MIWSGIAKGVAISASILGQLLLHEALPQAPWAHAVASLGYALEFLIVLGRLQLFIESTLSVVIPVTTHPTLGNVGRLMRFCFMVLGANLRETLFIAYLNGSEIIASPKHRAA